MSVLQFKNEDHRSESVMSKLCKFNFSCIQLTRVAGLGSKVGVLARTVGVVARRVRCAWGQGMAAQFGDGIRQCKLSDLAQASAVAGRGYRTGARAI